MRLRAASRTALVSTLGWSLTALLLQPQTIHAAPPAVAAGPALELSLHSTPADALTAVLTRAERESGLRVVAFGEYHQTTAMAKKGAPVSSLRRFSGELFGVLAPRASDIVLETWVTDGNCGSQETTAVAKVEKTTERPQTTENELVTLVKQAKSAGVQPHILRLSCDDYKSMLSTDGQVDFEKLLGLLTTLLHKKISAIATARTASVGKAPPPAAAAPAEKAPTAAAGAPASPSPAPAPTATAAAPVAPPPAAAAVAVAAPPPASPTPAAGAGGAPPGDRMILVYGGGLHNDLLPRAELAAYTFGPKVRDEQGGRYLEIDLYVPEYIERDPSMTKEPWFQLYKKRVRPGQTVVIRRLQGSYIIIFPRRRG